MLNNHHASSRDPSEGDVIINGVTLHISNMKVRLMSRTISLSNSLMFGSTNILLLHYNVSYESFDAVCVWGKVVVCDDHYN